MIPLVLIVGMIAGALLATAYFGICNLLKENAQLRKELEAGKKRLPQNADNNLAECRGRHPWIRG